MCFSTGASFGAGAVLTAIGVASLKQTREPAQVPFASIPLIFGAQQITEGFVWLALSDPEFAPVERAASYGFIVFAQIIWPVWVPFAILKLDLPEGQKWTGKILMGIGLLVSAWFAYCMLAYNIQAKIIGHHISYEQDYPPAMSLAGQLCYAIATIVPALMSRVKGMWQLGTAIFISYVMTAIFYTDYVVSVWCFFSSLISIGVFFIVRNLVKSRAAETANTTLG